MINIVENFGWTDFNETFRKSPVYLASNSVKFGDDRSTTIFELSNCQIQLLFTMMIFYSWVYMGVDNDLHPLEKRIEENEYGEI
ncbi:jg21278 [Pararge aegeria aegeria]|uniref:Jg21278 protein n=1 Tax=Pararge aegeria aegeria TaxID=348720 RepID=A0A8S4SBK9_9NEOP|nr:jg21278 [Pararge aegeria aegeria]